MGARKFLETRRKNDLHWLEALVPSLALLVCVALAFPPWRAIILGMGVVFTSVLGGIFLAAFAALFVRRMVKHSSPATWGSGLIVERPLRSFDLSTLQSVAGEEVAVEEVPESPSLPALPHPVAPSIILSVSPPATLRLAKHSGGEAEVKKSVPVLKLAPAKPLVAPKNKILTTADLVERLRSIDWFQFETILEMMYEKQGYSVTRRGGTSLEDGIDMILEKDGSRLAIHCKQWKNWQVSEKSLRTFANGVAAGNYAKGLVVLLSGCVGPARKVADEHGLEFVEERHLMPMLELMKASDNPTVLALLKDECKYCPKCESEMVLLAEGQGGNATGQSWSCSTAPQCDYTLQVP